MCQLRNEVGNFTWKKACKLGGIETGNLNDRLRKLDGACQLQT